MVADAWNRAPAVEIHSWSKYFTPQWIPSPSQLHLAPCSKKQGTPGQPTPKLPCMSKSQAIQALALKRCSWLVKQIQLDNFQSKWDTWPAVPGLQWLWSWSLGESQLPASLVLGGTLLFQQLHRWVLWEPPEAKGQGTNERDGNLLLQTAALQQRHEASTNDDVLHLHVRMVIHSLWFNNSSFTSWELDREKHFSQHFFLPKIIFLFKKASWY